MNHSFVWVVFHKGDFVIVHYSLTLGNSIIKTFASSSPPLPVEEECAIIIKGLGINLFNSSLPAHPYIMLCIKSVLLRKSQMNPVFIHRQKKRFPAPAFLSDCPVILFLYPLLNSFAKMILT
jgi:hypothetical protein